MHYTHFSLFFARLMRSTKADHCQRKKVEENKFQREKGRVVSSLFEEIIFCGGGEIFFEQLWLLRVVYLYLYLALLVFLTQRTRK